MPGGDGRQRHKKEIQTSGKHWAAHHRRRVTAATKENVLLQIWLKCLYDSLKYIYIYITILLNNEPTCHLSPSPERTGENLGEEKKKKTQIALIGLSTREAVKNAWWDGGERQSTSTEQERSDQNASSLLQRSVCRVYGGFSSDLTSVI